MAEFNLTPVFRMEMFIDAIINGTTPPVPQFREEFYFAKVAGMDVELPTPITRREFYLAKYAGMNVDLPVPVTRDEMYLALACGLGVEPPEPVFRDEYWLYELSGGGKWSWKTVSGSMIHITDAVFFPMQKCEVTLEPIQDLHGQDAPYPAGGGVNKIACNDGIDFTLKGVRYYVEDGKLYLNGTSQGETSSADAIFETNFKFTLSAGSYYFSRGSSRLATYLIHYVDGAKVALVTNSGAFTLSEAEEVWVGFYVYNAVFTNEQMPVQIVSGSQDPTVYSPYSNICPITGWTGCEVTRTGENLFNPNCEKTPVSGNLLKPTIKLKPNTYYTATSNVPQSSTANIYFGGTSTASNGVWLNQARSVTTDSNGDLTFLIRSPTFDDLINGTYWLQVKEGSTETDYKPYSGTTLSVTFPDSAGTVYGGTVDLVSGVLTVDRGIITYNGSDITFEYGSFYGMPCRTAQISNLKRPSSSTSLSGIKSNYLKEIKQASTWGVVGTFSATTVDSRLYICVDSSIDSQNALNQYLAEHPLTFCYELAEPITIQLTPQEISTLKGVNNVWSNSNGDTTIIYKAQSS